MKRARNTRGVQTVLWVGTFALAVSCGDDAARRAAADDAADTGGDDADGGSDGGDDRDHDRYPSWDGCEPDAPISVLRRLTRTQYGRTIHDLLGREVEGLDDFVADEKIGAFDVNLNAPVSEVAVEDYMIAAERLAEAVVDDLGMVVPCDLDDQACPAEFVRDFGARAYRRPLEESEVARALALFDAADSAEEGVQLVIQGMLQSPYFLYQLELGMTPTGDEEVVPLTDHELASRLSYMLWGSMPDAELRAVADSGALHETDTLTTQVERMLEDERTASAIGHFHVQWMGMDDLSAAGKQSAEDWATLSSSMAEELQRFSSWVILEDDARLATLLTTPTGFVDGALAELYGVELPAGAEPSDFTRIELDPDQRGGLLTLAGVLAAHAHGIESAPVLRGQLVQENLILCGPLPPPPPEVNDGIGELDPNLPAKQRYAEHATDGTCAACHQLMDPLGFGFEHYDGLGAYRTMETLGNGEAVPVDATGELAGADVEASFDGAVELSKLLAMSSVVHRCMVHQWMQFGLSRPLTNADQCSNEALIEDFLENDGDLRTMLHRLASSTAMRHIRVKGER